MVGNHLRPRGNGGYSMSETPCQAPWIREEFLQLLSVAGTLAGLCITGVTLFHTSGKVSLSQSLADDLLGISALLFLLCTYAISWRFAPGARHWPSSWRSSPIYFSSWP